MPENRFVAARYGSVPEASHEVFAAPAPVPQKVGTELMSWKTVADRREELDEWGKNIAAMAERDKKRVYREELEEQKRLVTRRRQLQKERDLDEEKANLALNSEMVQAKLREQQARQVVPRNFDDFLPGKGRAKAQYLMDSNLFNKVEYQKAQTEQLEKEKLKVQAEIGRALKQTEADYVRKPFKEDRIVSSTIKDLYPQTTRDLASDLNPDLPLTNTRRHYKSLTKGTSLLRFDPLPSTRRAGLTNPVRHYDPINGEMDAMGAEKPAGPERRLPEFLQNKYEGRFYEQIRNEGRGTRALY